MRQQSFLFNVQKMNKKTSIHDIANELNVSISTVSAVLNGKSKERRISIALQERILAYTQKIDFQPNMFARGLRTGKSHIFGMLVEDISDPFFAAIARKVEQNAAIQDYKIFYSSTENKLNIARSLIKTFRERQVDAYIIAPPPGLEKDIEQLINDGKIVVIFDRHLPSIKTHNVLVDNYNGTIAAVELFIKNGRKNIALVTLDSNQTQMEERLRGYQKAIEKTGQKELILRLSYHRGMDDITPQLQTFIQKNRNIDAILFTTNYLTASGLKALKALSIPIPQEVAVIGYDDNVNFSLYTPSITAVAQPAKSIADGIMQLLTDMLKNNGNADSDISIPENIILKTNLILRESV